MLLRGGDQVREDIDGSAPALSAGQKQGQGAHAPLGAPVPGRGQRFVLQPGLVGQIRGGKVLQQLTAQHPGQAQAPAVDRRRTSRAPRAWGPASSALRQWV